MQPSFVHLRVHSDFSMMDGITKVKPLVKHAQAQQMPAFALTDIFNFCGLIKFYTASHEAGIKPIIGSDLFMQFSQTETERYHLTLLVKNLTGYKNLTLLISKAYARGAIDGHPVIDRAWLVEHKEGLIVLSGATKGDLGVALIKKNMRLLKEVLSFYQEHFPQNYYIELQRLGRINEPLYLTEAVTIAQTHSLPVVATNEVCFLEASQFEAHEIRVAIHDGYTMADPRRPKNYTKEQYFKSEEQMCELFSDIPEALTNSVEIAKRCNLLLSLGTPILPDFPTGEMDVNDYLIRESKAGLERRLLKLFPDESTRLERRPEYDERLDVELKVINQMEFPGYFLIVMEFIQWAKDNDIPVGPGRGSGAGSLVAYALDITDLDPLEYDLLFERFLNPERVSMPDFDIDFCMDKRERVIEHVSETYGRDAVSQIITFGTMSAKAVIRDVGRALGMSYGQVDRLAKLIPTTPGMTLKQAFEEEAQLQQICDEDEETDYLIKMARMLEGVVRNVGKHAGGVVIAPNKITDFSPLHYDNDGSSPMTQFDKNDIEAVGLVKFDFLGLRTLTIIDWAVQMINIKRSALNQEPIDISEISLEDKPSYELFKEAETSAVFQLESTGMKGLIKKLQPDCFEDIIALVALFRPGPLESGMIDNFIDRKHGREEVAYPDKNYQHELLQPVLEPTYGIIVYQEQVMQIAQVLAGYSLGEADMLRRAMGKKKPEEMAKQRSVFKEGAENNNIDGDLALKIFDLVEKFAGYGFNKSHSAAYALVAFQTLWLKAHYPAEFMAANMSAVMDHTDKIVNLISECRRLKLELLPPDINKGQYKFSVETSEADQVDTIIYGLGAIKGVGEAVLQDIVREREQNGLYKDLFDFCARLANKKLTKRVLESLIYSGAMDKLGPHRAALHASISDATQAASQFYKAQQAGQLDMFGVLLDSPEMVAQSYQKIPAWSEKKQSTHELETLGLYLISHPMEIYADELQQYTSFKLAELQRRDDPVTVAGLLVSKRIITRKNNSQFGIILLDDNSAQIEVTIDTTQEKLKKQFSALELHQLILLKGQVSFDQYRECFRIKGNEIYSIEQMRDRHAKSLSLCIDVQQCTSSAHGAGRTDGHPFLTRLIEILRPCQGDGTIGRVPLVIYYQSEEARVRLYTTQSDTPFLLMVTDELIHTLKQYLGENQVQLEF